MGDVVVFVKRKAHVWWRFFVEFRNGRDGLCAKVKITKELMVFWVSDFGDEKQGLAAKWGRGDFRPCKTMIPWGII